MTEFTQQVVAWIRKIPKGKVATYAQIAALAGKPHASRGVAWILNSSSGAHSLPWHRVINSQGKISFPKASSSFRQQRQKLQKEKVEVSATGAVTLMKFGWSKRPRKTRRRNTPRMFE